MYLCAFVETASQESSECSSVLAHRNSHTHDWEDELRNTSQLRTVQLNCVLARLTQRETSGVSYKCVRLLSCDNSGGIPPDNLL